MNTAVQTNEQGVQLPFSLTEVMGFQAPDLLIERFCKEQGVEPWEARELFEETKKFLVACASDRSRAVGLDRALSPSKIVDEMWHGFILFTPEYTRFCDLLGGYVHHCPTRTTRPGARDEAREVVAAIFGEASPKYWNASAGCTADQGGSQENGGGSCNSGGTGGNNGG